MKEYSRIDRLAEEIQHALATLIQREIKDPRVGMVTVTRVQLARDVSHARVYVTLLDGAHDAELSVKILNRAAPFLRHALGERVQLQFLPRLQFVHDKQSVREQRLNELIQQAVRSDKAAHKE
ncbi:MAG: 30S ribosome-binding factor RbfA [Gammaproteobacteria bacterium]|nr:30S ribosome-binding factor RbfA [Gammaproteobacteria bacterium]